MFISNIQQTILELLMKKPGLYGLEMVKTSAELKRATIYVHLSRMEEKNWIRSEAEKDPLMSGLPRRRYFITGEGQRAYSASIASAAIYGAPLGSAV